MGTICRCLRCHRRWARWRWGWKVDVVHTLDMLIGSTIVRVRPPQCNRDSEYKLLSCSFFILFWSCADTSGIDLVDEFLEVFAILAYSICKAI